jgi:hypothetical protein
MSLLRARRSVIAATLALVGHSAQAAVLASLTFIQPTGVASTTDVIPMWVRLSLAPGSDSVSLTAPYDSAYIDWYCEDGGFSDCSPGGSSPGEPGEQAQPSPYVVNGYFGQDSWFEVTQRPGFVMNAGDSIDLHLVDLVPRSGSVPAGFYQQQNVGLSLYPSPQPEDAGSPWLEPLLEVRTSCESSPSACTFSRNVIAAVPEVGTFWLSALGGIGLLGLVAMRRRSTT